MYESEVTGIVTQNKDMKAIIDRLERKVRAVQSIPWEEIQDAMSQITEEADKGLYGLVCYYAAFYMMYAGRQDECLGYLNESIRCMVGTEQECQLSRCYNILGMIFQSQNNLIGAMEQYGKSLFYAKEYNQLFYQCLAECNMGDSYYRVGKYDRAVVCYGECLRDLKLSGLHRSNKENSYRKILAGYGYCLVMNGQIEEAADVAEELKRSISENDATGTEDLSVDGFFALWYDKMWDAEKFDFHLNRAIEVIVKGCTIALEYDRIMNLIQMLILTERFESLHKILAYLEPQALIENNEGFLLQLRLFRLRYCSENMEQESFVENMHAFFSLKDEFENAQNSQIPRLLSLRARLDEIEHEQKQLKRENLKLLYQTEHDELSGLHNKRSMSRYMEEVFEEAIQEEMPFAVVFVDIDYFKQMNDRYGHKAGDDCIVAISGILQECMQDDFVARYGGDEFVILLKNKSKDYVREHTQAIEDRVRALAILNEDAPDEKIVTVTQGVVYGCPHKGSKRWDFLSAADMALYEQKNLQRGKVGFFAEFGNT